MTHLAAPQVLGIDPGPVYSAYALIDAATCAPLEADKVDSGLLLSMILGRRFGHASTAIEMVASYGMAVGAEVFDTCVWIGRFHEALRSVHPDDPPTLVTRARVKLHHCHSPRANDATITQALIDRFAYGQRNRGKGTKSDPGFFYGFRADMWQAFALAVYWADTTDPGAVASIHTTPHDGV